MKKIIISGANFNNKGAQSMLFIVADEMRRRFPDCEISFLSSEDIDLSNYRMRQLYFSVETSKILNLDLKAFLLLCKRYSKEVLKKIIKKGYHIRSPLFVLKELNDCDFIVDVSGYQLGDKWPKDLNYLFLNVIKYSYKKRKPIYLMPQSYGPFNYEDLEKRKRNKLISDISEYMKYPAVVYAREKTGELALKEIGVNKVILSPDMVLQNEKIDLNNVYINVPEIKLPKINDNSVGIVPNAQCFKFGDDETIMSLYQGLINELLLHNKTVYLIKHSGEDYKICETIKRLFEDEERVIFLDRSFSCIEYDALVKKFELIISSRYHGAVHALRNYVPCMTLGWADKYLELMKLIGMEQYNFDISQDINIEMIVSSSVDMISKLDICKAIITESVGKIRKQSCFSVFDNKEA